MPPKKPIIKEKIPEAIKEVPKKQPFFDVKIISKYTCLVCGAEYEEPAIENKVFPTDGYICAKDKSKMVRVITNK